MGLLDSVDPALIQGLLAGGFGALASRGSRLNAIGQGGLSGKVLALWGLAFKANTDDIREAASLDLIQALTAAGMRVNAFDPVPEPPPKECTKFLRELPPTVALRSCVEAGSVMLKEPALLPLDVRHSSPMPKRTLPVRLTVAVIW